jgi:hypothetical protein
MRIAASFARDQTYPHVLQPSCRRRRPTASPLAAPARIASSDLIQWPAADVEAVLNQVRWVSKTATPAAHAQHLRVLALVDLPFGLALSHRRCKPRAPSPDRWLSDSALPQAISHDLDGATAADSGHMAVGPKHFEFCEDARGPGAEGCGEKAALL